jgi:uncharacterized membrane protein
MRRGGCLVAAVLALVSVARADDPARKLTVVTPKDDGIQATGINSRGEVIGFEWVEEKARPGVLDQKPFFARGKEVTYLPVLKGYTATFPAAVSDGGVVVGRASKPAPLAGPRVYLRNQAFVWDARTGIHGLGVPPDDWASFACGITRDGRLISGFSVGDDRVRPCVWERNDGGWTVTVLPSSPKLGSTTVAISGTGRYVASADGTSACLWSRDATGKWTREMIAESAAIIPRAVNDAGTVVGVRGLPDGTVHAVVSTRGGGVKTLPEPAGYISSEANAVSDDGLVVGMVDGPHGSRIGPNAFVYANGRLRLIDEGGPRFINATAINNQVQVAGVLESDDEPEPPKPDPSKKPG